MKSINELRAMRTVYIGGLGRVRFQRYEDQEQLRLRQSGPFKLPR